MPADIGIDLGTTKIIVYESGRGVVFREPNIVAVNNDNGEVLAVGESAYKMVGRTPGYITARSPLGGGVISDYKLTNVLIHHALKKVCGDSYLKPRVAICVPSIITDVEQRAVVDAALAAGARKVFLIEEPVAAAMGAGLDISKAEGRLIVDIGGGTSDIALLSLSGVVCKHSIKLAGQRFDEEIIKYVRLRHGILIGEKMAEEVKKNIGTCWNFDDDRTFEVKGRNLLTGLPGRVTLHWEELSDIFYDLADQLAAAIQKVFEKTPPELAGDVKSNGILLTGGGARLHGLDKYLEKRFNLKCHVAENPEECVAIGTGESFNLQGYLRDCVSEANNRLHG
ncbi:MAG: rod shape-determining protein [Oscillospiraceae bacterium]|nr:rod shape-determining protein [Oscillospiraceae bacterium]